MPATGFIDTIKNALPWANKEVPLTQEQLAQTASTLTNPGLRLELPTDFPRLLLLTDIAAIRSGLDAVLREKHKTTLREAGRVNIVYPHKHPLKFPKHQNNADKYARDAWYALEGADRKVEWVLGASLTELVRLDRSENQSSVHALTGKQEYALYDALQQSPRFTFGAPGNTRKEYFLMVDSGFEQGTTLANLYSFITANGGIVLAGAVPNPSAGSLQQDPGARCEPDDHAANLRPEFMDAARNTARLPQMALAFAESAEREGLIWTPQQSLDLFEAALNKHGNTVYGLTDGEAVRIIETVGPSPYHFSMPFPKLLEGIEAKPARHKAHAP